MKFYEDPRSENPVAHPAATVIPLRETSDGFEILLIHRNPGLSFQGGMWAFPGGRIEASDYEDENDDTHDHDMHP